MKIVLHTDRVGRIYWIDENHPSSDADHVMCRVVEGDMLKHSTIRSRADLTVYLITDMNADGTIINMGKRPAANEPLAVAGYALLAAASTAEGEMVTIEARVSADYAKNLKAARESLHNAARRFLHELLMSGTTNSRLNSGGDDSNTKA
jgi:hypothetical protein